MWLVGLGEIYEYDYQEVVGVKSMGVNSGCSCKEVYIYFFSYYLSLLLLYTLLLAAASLLFSPLNFLVLL